VNAKNYSSLSSLEVMVLGSMVLYGEYNGKNGKNPILAITVDSI
jgi:hypothetical protein